MDLQVTIDTVCLFISKDSTEFPATHGARVKAAGGRYSDIRGRTASHRYVHLPFSERELIDEIMVRYSTGPKRIINVTGVTSTVLDRNRCHFISSRTDLGSIEWNWKSGEKPSDFVERVYARQLAAKDFSADIARWQAEDRRNAEYRKAKEIGERIAELRERIATESVRILEGANDIDPLKELAAEYLEVCREAGLEIPDVQVARPHAPKP